MPTRAAVLGRQMLLKRGEILCRLRISKQGCGGMVGQRCWNTADVPGGLNTLAGRRVELQWLWHRNAWLGYPGSIWIGRRYL
jgi:hypothetical protein